MRQLNADPEAPWRDLGPAGLTTARLGRLLGEFDIKSANVRFTDGSQAKGYRRGDFADAWSRYCPLPQREASHPSQASQPRSKRDASDDRDGLKRPVPPIRPTLTSIGTLGTDGTDIPFKPQGRGAA
ncbi:hypothetical protein GCM10010470_62990 [Saccharopolyspora taberi]|uniref:DUF3631 domain-containing protein n=1 Tax=Saccharopolyspora taberi TaxID=60895 RepID=A0ABN3VM93_9PSEU